ncbi:MAG: hypothetical protein JNM43_04650 [Planctomycetaceae bacterium]|nr:hypothetical protein [Planctomycetaceae bacterium]
MKTTTNLLVVLFFITVSTTPLPQQQSRRDSQPNASKLRTDDIPPEMYQYSVSRFEEKREALDFVAAVPELIQQSLLRRKVLIYDQN